MTQTGSGNPLTYTYSYAQLGDDPCDCAEWEKGINQVNAAITFAFTHEFKYTGGVFRFCPWCGGARPEKVRLDVFTEPATGFEQ